MSPSMSSVATAQVASPPPASRASAGRCPDPRRGGQHRIEDADQLEERVAEPDQAVERPELLVPAATAGHQAQGAGDLVRGAIRVRDGDDQVIDAEDMT